MFRKKLKEEPMQEVEKVEPISNKAQIQNQQTERDEVQEDKAREESSEENKEEAQDISEEDVIKILTEFRNALSNHEARVSNIEATLFRLKSLV